MKTAKTGAFLATAVGLMFMANVAMPQGNSAAEALWSLRPPRSRGMGANSCNGNSSLQDCAKRLQGTERLQRQGFC